MAQLPQSGAASCHPGLVSRTQRRRRALFAACAGLSACAFIVLALAFVREPFHDMDLLVALWWASGLGALGCGVAACAVAVDLPDDGSYLLSIVRGLRDEWRRS